MPQDNSKQTFTLKPSWKQFFTAYVLSVLAIPLFGLGLIALYFVRRKHNRLRYKISDSRITRIDEKYEHNVDVADIEGLEIQKSWLDQKLQIGTLVLHTSASKMELAGLDNPQKFKDILEQAVESEKERLKQRSQINEKEPKYQPGNMDKIDYLTGLWQQGLLSDDDYKSERKDLE